MQKVNFNLLPFSSYTSISAETVFILDSLFKKIRDNGDSVIVPEEFYMLEDVDGKSFTSVIGEFYAEHHDELSLLLDLVVQRGTVSLSYDELFQEAREQNGFRDSYIGFVKEAPEDNFEHKALTATDTDTLKDVYRYIARYFLTYSDFYEWRCRCFPCLLFTKDVFENSEKIGPYPDNYSEICRCLSVLNDESSILHSAQNENEAIKILQSKTGVHCSGKGANETSTFKKKVIFQKVEYEISCIPHFKLDAANSNKRLHFSWGQDRIASHKIIVVHLGEHWKSENSKCSKIE